MPYEAKTPFNAQLLQRIDLMHVYLRELGFTLTESLWILDSGILYMNYYLEYMGHMPQEYFPHT